MIDKINESGKIKCEFQNELNEKDLPFTLENKINLLRIFQEIINNILKYSSCSNLLLELSRETSGIKFFMEHDGRPFDNEQAVAMIRNGKGLGLLSVVNRVQIMGGEIDYFRNEKGSSICLRFPSEKIDPQ